jgi:four helix bundle protein
MGVRLSSYRDLVVWQKSIELVTEAYSVTKEFPREEIYGLTSQIRRSAVSVPSNIAEGQGRATKGEFIQFLCHARGSLFELETQIVIARNLGYVAVGAEERLGAKITEVARILNGLLTSLGVASRKPVR